METSVAMSYMHGGLSPLLPAYRRRNLRWRHPVLATALAQQADFPAEQQTTGVRPYGMDVGSLATATVACGRHGRCKALSSVTNPRVEHPRPRLARHLLQRRRHPLRRPPQVAYPRAPYATYQLAFDRKGKTKSLCLDDILSPL